jgi:hypothetical protein
MPTDQQEKRRFEEGWINAPEIHVGYPERRKDREKCFSDNNSCVNSLHLCSGIFFPCGLRQGSIGEEEMRECSCGEGEVGWMFLKACDNIFTVSRSIDRRIAWHYDDIDVRA